MVCDLASVDVLPSAWKASLAVFGLECAVEI